MRLQEGLDPIGEDHFWMKRCLHLAERAFDEGNTPVGALIVQGSVPIGEAWELRPTTWDVTAHAELFTVREACAALNSSDLSGASLYSTAEPCVMCSYALRRAGIARVVFGTWAGQAGGVRSGYALLVDPELAGWPPPPRVTSGVLAFECEGLLERWHARKRGKARR